MNSDGIADFLTRLRARLATSGKRTGRILAETEDHLIETAERLMSKGLSREQAEREAVARFGTPDDLAREFQQSPSAWLEVSMLIKLVIALLVLITSLSLARLGNVFRSRTGWLVGIVLIGLAVGFSITAWKAHRGVSSTLVRRPFTATTLVKTYELEPNVEFSSKAIVEAYRSDGSHMVSEQQHRHAVVYGAPVSHESRRIVNVADRAGHTVFPKREEVYSYRIAERLVAYLKEPGDCAQATEGVDTDTSPHPRTILGYRVVKKSIRLPEAHSTALMEYEYWQAPQLGCYALREVRRRIYPTTGESWEIQTSDAVAVSEGEPDPKLFSIPRDLRVHSAEDPRIQRYAQVAEAIEFLYDKPIWARPEALKFP